MKKIVCFVLAGILLLSCTACARGGEDVSFKNMTKSTAASTLTSTTLSTTATTTKPTEYQRPLFKTSVRTTAPSKRVDIADATGVPYCKVSADKLTNIQAREILEVLIPRQFEVFHVFQLDFDKVDESQTSTGKIGYALCTDERFTCVQDIKDFILRVYTEKEAKRYFDGYLNDEVSPYDGAYYVDYNERLYRNILVEGKGLQYAMYLPETTRIISCTENTVKVEMDAEQREDESREIYSFMLCKTPDGWRLDSPFLDSYYSE